MIWSFFKEKLYTYVAIKWNIKHHIYTEPNTSLIEYLNLSQVTGLPPKTSPKNQLTGLTGSCLLLTTLFFKINLVFSMNVSKYWLENWLSWPQLPIDWHQARPIWLTLNLDGSWSLFTSRLNQIRGRGCFVSILEVTFVTDSLIGQEIVI